MNRRHLLCAALSAPVLAMPLPALAATSRITWEADALSHPQALVVARSLHQLISDRIMYPTGEWTFDRFVKLEDPRFVVRRGGRIWNWMNGFTQEEGLLISATEMGVDLGETGLFTSIGFESYWQTLERDMTRHPDYGLRRFHQPYELRADEAAADHPRRVAHTEIDDALPKGHAGLDIRWLQHLKEAHDA